MSSIDKERLAASVVMIGFEGTHPSEGLRQLIRSGAAGAIFMRRNVTTPAATFDLSAELRAVAGRPFLVSVDQEGGRVARLREGFTALPPLRRIGQTKDPATARQMGQILGRECRAVGFDLDFAPVIDVDSNPQNPVIGDRSFGPDPSECARLGAAMIVGLQQESIAACAKHFPGHGDTHQDSHLELPRVSHDLARLRAIELPPFRAAVQTGVATLMTAHVIIDALDSVLPATLSPRTLTTLRDEIGFQGVMISDDLEMAAISDRFAISEAAWRAVAAGCDLLLVCHRADRQWEAVEGLCHWAETSAANLERLRQASERVTQLAAKLAPSIARTFEANALRRPDALAFAGRFAAEASHDPTERPLPDASEI
jgi:beta-N-acetylhexosaminidase